jgi:UDP-N-acetylmuramoylalanine--D-glutamate ligase
VRELGGTSYYDDSISTTVGSAIAAMRSFEQPVVLILGGSSKGVDFTAMAKTVVERRVKRVVLIGPEGVTRIKAALAAEGYNAVSELAQYTMDEVVAEAKRYTEAGDVVVLSPACASFDAYANYAARGEDFVNAVNRLQ